MLENEHVGQAQPVTGKYFHEYKADDMIVTTYFTRFNQISIEELREQGRTEFHNIDVGRGIHFVIASKPTNSINSNFR